MDSSNNMMLQQQKIMLYLFPLIFAISGVNFPVVVLIYWSTTNFWTWGQQYYVIKRNPTPGSPAFEELARKKAKKEGRPVEGSLDEATEGQTHPQMRLRVSEANQRRKRRRSNSDKYL